MTKIQIDDHKGGKAAKKPVAKKKTRKIAVNKVSSAKKPVSKPSSRPAQKSTAKKSSATKKTVTRKIAINSVSSSATHDNLQKSTTLSRRYVNRPRPIKITEQPSEQSTAIQSALAPTSAPKPVPAPEVQSEPTPTPEPEVQPKPVPATEPEVQPAPEPAPVSQPEVQPAPASVPVSVPTPTPAPKLAAKPRPAQKTQLREKSKPQSAVMAKKKRHFINRASKSNPDRALKSAARAADIVDTPKDAPVAKNTTLENQFKRKHRGRRIFFALLCSAATVGALVAFVHFNMPDISVRVAAMQTGIEATYPTFVPRNYSLATVSTDKDGAVIMNFTGPENASFVLSEEKSTWDSAALLNNYVKKNYPSDYATIREQGITIYARGEKASWVNGGILYKITASGKNLTKEQVRNIATSL